MQRHTNDILFGKDKPASAAQKIVSELQSAIKSAQRTPSSMSAISELTSLRRDRARTAEERRQQRKENGRDNKAGYSPSGSNHPRSNASDRLERIF